MSAKIPLPNLEGTGYTTMDEICTKYYQDTFRFILSRIHNEDTAADLTQITFEKITKSIGNYKKAEHEDKEKALKNWIFKIAVNNVINYKRRENKEIAYSVGMSRNLTLLKTYEEIINRNPTAFKAGTVNETNASSNPEEDYLEAESGYYALALLEGIKNPEIREALRLRVFEDYSYQEISREQDIQIGTVMSRLYRGREEIKKRLKNYE